MKKFFFILGLSFLWLSQSYTQTEDTTKVNEPVSVKTEEVNPVYYGGTIGFSFGEYFRMSIEPMVGYRFTPKISAGVKIGYEYINDSRYHTDVIYHNYGGSVFGRYRIIPKLYFHSEFAYFSYQYKVSDFKSEREWVPFIYLGGGFVQPISPNTSLIVEVLFDVLQDDNSPYEDWDPFISIGVGVGF